MDVRLRVMTRADLPLLAGWLREPLVAAWWHDDPEAVEEQYGPALDGRDPAVLRIALVAGRPVGFVQWYRYADEPARAEEVERVLPLPPGAVGLDFLLGEPTARGRGWGTRLIAAAVAAIVPAPLVVAVHAGNGASIGALRRAGFRVAAHGELPPDDPALGPEHVVLVR